MMWIVSYIHYVCTANDIGPEGAKGLGEALKHNTTLTTMDLGCIDNDFKNIFDGN